MEKIFTATNKGNSSVTYGAALESIVNELLRQEDLVYTLTCTSYLKEGFSLSSNGTITGTVDGICNGVTTEKQFPSTSTMSIMTTNTIDTTHTHAYKLTVTYKEMNVDQSTDMNKTFSAKVNIVDTNALTVNNPYKSDTGTLKKTIIDNAMLGTGSTQLGSEVTTFTSISGENEKVLNTAPDDYGDSYYYRGNVTDNYVKFAGFTWRIVRVNGDGSVRLILDGVTSKVKKEGSDTVAGSNTAFNSSYNQNAYVRYMYGTPGSTTYSNEHEFKGNKTTYKAADSSTHTGHSKIKVELDKFYETYLKTDYSEYLADTMFCGDKSLASSTIGSSNTAKGFESNISYYAATERLYYSSGETSITNAKPTLKCASGETNDYSRYTVNGEITPKGVITNGDLTYPIALLSADELVTAGAFKNKGNTNYYLYNADTVGATYWWTLSPYYFNYGYTYEFFSSSSNSLGSSLVPNSNNGARPVINLKSNVLINSGSGTSGDSYTISS